MRILQTLLLVACCVLCPAQTPQPLAFGVASVKPQKFTGEGTVGFSIKGDTLHAERVELNKLIEYAYNVQDFELSGGPSWAAFHGLLGSELFEVMAKAPPGQTTTPEQFQLMMQALLADRFHLQIHRLSKPLPAYNLVVGAGGSKLKTTAGGKSAINLRPIGGKDAVDRRAGLHITATNVTIDQIVHGQIGRDTGRPTFDKTGLTGHYDFTLEYLQDPTSPLAAESTLPPLSSALPDQLGLKLESTTAPYDTIVIDHAEKPSEN
jgi:uncharacterized protein (TIGR03435 family)